MPITAAQLLDLIDAAVLRRDGHGESIGGGRRQLLEHLRSTVVEHGLPLPDTLKLDCCSMPYIFQELNYDGYDWSSRDADLGLLSDIVDIDVVVWSGGATRQEISDSDYDCYRDFCCSAIKHRRAR